MRKLGRRQKEVLRILRQRREWRDGFYAGWVWGSLTETRTVLDSLVRRGLVRVDDGVYTPVPISELLPSTDKHPLDVIRDGHMKGGSRG